MNPNTHIYLYAKGHYAKNDIIDDLKIIMGHRSMISPENIQMDDIWNVISSLTFKHIVESGNPENSFQQFVLKLMPWDNKIIYNEFWKNLFSSCLSILRFVRVENLDLGKADSNILPLSDSIKEEMR